MAAGLYNLSEEIYEMILGQVSYQDGVKQKDYFS
jgi:hypothetical protein